MIPIQLTRVSIELGAGASTPSGGETSSAELRPNCEHRQYRGDGEPRVQVFTNIEHFFEPQEGGRRGKVSCTAISLLFRICSMSKLSISLCSLFELADGARSASEVF